MSKTKTLTNNQKQEIQSEVIKANSIVLARAGYSNAMGTTHAGQRDLYKECGYKQNLSWNDYWIKYDRNCVAKRIVNAFPESTWAQYPKVYEDNEFSDTAFEKKWKQIVKKVKVFPKLVRADIMAGIDEFSIILLGFDDSNQGTTSLPVTKANNLLYMKPVLQMNVSIQTTVTDISDERYGLPEQYTVNIDDAVGNSVTTQTWHHSRVLHIADNILDNEYRGTSRLKAVFNRLQDIETVMGASAEMVWKQSFPGLSFNADADADLSQTKDELKEQIQEYSHGLSRYMQLQGIQVQELKGQIQNPSPILDCILKIIATETKIPVRILTGSEEAKLASGTDKQNYQDRVTQRRDHFALPFILEPLIDKLISFGVLPDVEYKTEWDDVYAMTKKDRIDIAQGITKALANYVKTPGLDMLLTPKWYLINILKYKEEELVGLDLEAYVSSIEEERELELAGAELDLEQKKQTDPNEGRIEGEENRDNPEDDNRDVDGDIT